MTRGYLARARYAAAPRFSLQDVSRHVFALNTRGVNSFHSSALMRGSTSSRFVAKTKKGVQFNRTPYKINRSILELEVRSNGKIEVCRLIFGIHKVNRDGEFDVQADVFVESPEEADLRRNVKLAVDED